MDEDISSKSTAYVLSSAKAPAKAQIVIIITMIMVTITTTMNIITGYLSANSGAARIAGLDVLENPVEAKRHIGYLPEQPPLYLDMTVEEYLSFIYDIKRVSGVKRSAHLDEIVSLVGLTDQYKRLIRNLSKGYKQRVGMAQALVGNPEVLILDEPTVGLDPKQIIDILAIWGDAADNIHGVDGVGEVGAKKLVGKYEKMAG